MKIDIFWSYMMLKWRQSKICFNCSQKGSPEKKLGANEFCIEILGGSKNREIAQKYSFLDPHKIPMQLSFDPNFFSGVTF